MDVLEKLLSTIDHLHVCAGHPDKHFLEMAEDRKGKLMSSNGSVAAYVDKAASVELNGQTFGATLRSTKCQLLTSASKCSVCVAYRDSVRSMYHQWLKSSRKQSLCGSTSSHVNDKWLRTPERREKVQKLKKRVRSAENSVQYTIIAMELIIIIG